MRAALITAIMRGLVEELMPVAADPGKFLTEMNRSLHAILRRTKEPFLATAFYVVADVATGELRFANAGHPSPLRIRRREGIVEPLKSCDPRHGPALGLFDKSTYPDCRCPLSADEIILLFTDGLYEIDNDEHQEYGQERLIEAVRARLQLPMDDLLDQLLEEIKTFSGKKDFEDDVCVVGMEVGKASS